MKYTDLPFDLEKYFVKKKKKPAVSVGKIIGIGAGVAALAALFPYSIQIGDDKKSFKIKSLALNVSGKVDESDVWGIDINLPWLKSKCDSCQDLCKCYPEENCANPVDADDLSDLEAIDGVADER